MMPSDTRWNTMADSYESYLKNLKILVKVCKEKGDEVDQKIVKLMTRQYKGFQKIIWRGLSRLLWQWIVSRGKSDAVEIWLKLKADIKDYLTDRKDMGIFEKRISVALTPAHFLANVRDPRYQGNCLNPRQRNNAEKYVSVFQIFFPHQCLSVEEVNPLKNFILVKMFYSLSHLLLVGRIFSHELADNVTNVPMQLFTAVASSAGTEQVFSTFGSVHSNIKIASEKKRLQKLLLYISNTTNCQINATLLVK